MKELKSKKEFSKLLEDNIFILEKLGDRLKKHSTDLSVYTRQQLTALVRLHIGGRAKLKDIACREFIPNSNLCAIFRYLEQNGLVQRSIDENDRRNTWYSVTESGARLAQETVKKIHKNIENVFSNIIKSDEDKLISAMKTINNILTNMEIISEKK